MNQKIAVCVVFVAALFMAIMDATIVNVALPTLGREFGVPPDAVDSVSIFFMVSLAVFIPVSGWIGDRFGGRTTLMAAIILFTLASALCGLATSLNQLVLFRMLQGVGGGMLTPVGMAMLYRTFPPAERVRASAILTVPTALAPSLGPVLGGLFVTELSWRWVFFVNLPIGVAALIFGLVYLKEQERQPTTRFDLPGFLLAGAGFGLVMYAVSEGPGQGWQTSLLVMLAVGVVLLAALVVVELRRAHPMLDLRIYANRLFRSASLVMFLATVGFFGVLYLVALFLQDGLGQSALQSGLATFPEALGVLVGAQIITRRLYPRFGPRRVITLGLLLVALSMGLVALVDEHTNLWWLRVLMFTMGMGMSSVFVPSQAAGFATISASATGRASTLFNAQRQIGGAVGVAVLTTVVSVIGPRAVVGGMELPNLASYHWAFLTAAGFAILASLAGLTISDREAASTYSRRVVKPLVTGDPAPRVNEHSLHRD
jgi:EmrB/QacA subfamily drug resistance transporter